jgi:hypothetical protein
VGRVGGLVGAQRGRWVLVDIAGHRSAACVNHVLVQTVGHTWSAVAAAQGRPCGGDRNSQQALRQSNKLLLYCFASYPTEAIPLWSWRTCLLVTYTLNCCSSTCSSAY